MCIRDRVNTYERSRDLLSVIDYRRPGSANPPARHEYDYDALGRPTDVYKRQQNMVRGFQTGRPSRRISTRFSGTAAPAGAVSYTHLMRENEPSSGGAQIKS